MSDIDRESTVDLLSRVRAGEPQALEAIAARLLPRLRRWAAGRLPKSARDLSETGDLVQETIVGVLARLKDFEPRHEAALSVYLREALANRIRNEIRRASRRPSSDSLDLATEQPALDASPLESTISKQALDRYEAALNTLTPEDRSAIVGRLELHHSYQELSEAWGTPSPDAARKRVARAVRRLAIAMTDAG